MKFTTSCIITEDVNRLRDFYEAVLQIKPQGSGSYVEFQTGFGTLSLFSYEANEKMVPGLLLPKQNRSIILEFQVADVDREYERLQAMDIEWIKPPATQPWGRVQPGSTTRTAISSIFTRDLIRSSNLCDRRNGITARPWLILIAC